MTQALNRDTLAAYGLFAAMTIFAVLMTATGIDLKNSMILPVLAAAFAGYSAIAYLIDRVKNGR